MSLFSSALPIFRFLLFFVWIFWVPDELDRVLECLKMFLLIPSCFSSDWLLFKLIEFIADCSRKRGIIEIVWDACENKSRQFCCFVKDEYFWRRSRSHLGLLSINFYWDFRHFVLLPNFDWCIGFIIFLIRAQFNLHFWYHFRVRFGSFFTE